MKHLFFATLPVVALLAGSLIAADDKDKNDKNAPKPTAATVTKVDAKKGEITLKFTDAKGKEQEKVFKLTDDVKILDETGRVVKLDVFEAGHEALIVESEGKLKELRFGVRAARERRLSDSVLTLIELAESDPACTEDLQRIYDMLKKLDTAKDGKIDPKSLKTAADDILKERVKGVFERLDTNKDGKISKEEARGLIKENFDKIDTNKDGFITQEELLKAAREKHETKPTDTKPTDKEKN